MSDVKYTDTDKKPFSKSDMVDNEKDLRRRDAVAFEKHGHYVMMVNDAIVGWQFAMSAYQALMLSFPSHKGHLNEKYKALDFRVCRHEQVKEAELAGKLTRKLSYDDAELALVSEIKRLKQHNKNLAYENRGLRMKVENHVKALDIANSNLRVCMDQIAALKKGKKR